MSSGTDKDTLDSGASSKRPVRNRLAQEKSPYLLQHAGNPVDWYPWGEEAFTRATQEKRPVFLSIGYSSCHWCHVMAQESFEDEGVAGVLNRYFVCIKVDREERPDIDSVYMGICQQMTGQGGWPLTIVMTPEKKPFFAGTYFPRTSKAGRSGLSEILLRIADLWVTNRDELYAAADQVISAAGAVPVKPGERGPDRQLLDRGFEELAALFDQENGGFGRMPKFPAPHMVIFLIRYWQLTGKGNALSMAERTIDAIRRGGIWDQVGGGLHRYATDSGWFIPHFEKMLSDQALFVLACIEAYAATGKVQYRTIAEECITYTLRELRTPAGGFYTAEDADSPGGEGAYYLWTREEIIRIFGDEAEEVFSLFILTPVPGSNPACVLSAAGPDRVLAQKMNISEQDLANCRKTILFRLLQEREKRPRPERDIKILTDINALFCLALSRAGRVLGNPSYTCAAIHTLQYLEQSLKDENGQVLHCDGNDNGGIPGFADDYAFLIAAYRELYQSTFGLPYLTEAIRLNAEFMKKFHDPENGGFFTTSATATDLPMRKKEWYDGALPSANAMAFENLTRIYRLTGNENLADAAEKCSLVIAGSVSHLPSAITGFLAALACSPVTGNAEDLVIAGDPAEAGTIDLLNAARAPYLPGLQILVRPPGREGKRVDAIAPAAREKFTREGKPAAYLCTGTACRPPVYDPEALLKELTRKKCPG